MDREYIFDGSPAKFGLDFERIAEKVTGAHGLGPESCLIGVKPDRLSLVDVRVDTFIICNHVPAIIDRRRMQSRCNFVAEFYKDGLSVVTFKASDESWEKLSDVYEEIIAGLNLRLEAVEVDSEVRAAEISVPTLPPDKYSVRRQVVLQMTLERVHSEGEIAEAIDGSLDMVGNDKNWLRRKGYLPKRTSN